MTTDRSTFLDRTGSIRWSTGLNFFFAPAVGYLDLNGSGTEWSTGRPASGPYLPGWRRKSGPRPAESIMASVETMQKAWGVKVVHKGFGSGTRKRFIDRKCV